jgi:plasmid stabilization system protein ParE
VSRRTLIFSPAASRDLTSILSVIADGAGSRVAMRWRRTFDERTAALTVQPYVGAVDEDLGPGRRRLVVPPYLIVYHLPIPTEVVILRVVHGARDLRALFGDLPQG